MTSAGVASGRRWSSRATTPLVTAVAWLEPVPRQSAPPTRACGLDRATRDPGGRTPSTLTPLATRSGLATPATSPLPLQSATCGGPVREAAPTVRARGVKPGSPTSPGLLPAETTTVTPAARTRSTASVSGSAPYAVPGRWWLKERLATSTLPALRTTQSSPASTFDIDVVPSGRATRTTSTVAAGATPTALPAEPGAGPPATTDAMNVP